MVVEHKPRWVDIDAQYAQYRVNIETLDDPVPPSISSRRPMTALDVSGGEYLKGVHSAVLGGILETHPTVENLSSSFHFKSVISSLSKDSVI